MVLEIPQTLRPIQIYLRLADEHQIRDPVIAYYCRLHALQEGMKINKSSKECLLYLTNLMEILEKIKKENKGNDTFTSEIVGQAYVEAYALKLFVYADTEDRNSNFNKNVIKAFFSASILFDVLSLFGPITDEIEQQRKYAKWKAAYINDCIKKEIQPKPGPQSASEPISDDLPLPIDSSSKKTLNTNNLISRKPDSSDNIIHGDKDFNSSDSDTHDNPNIKNSNNNKTTINSSTFIDHDNIPQIFNNPRPSIPNNLPIRNNIPIQGYRTSPMDEHSGIDPLECANAEKLCKFAYSALQYQDIPTAITNLQQCLSILLKFQNKQ
ncbi:unnamed protein product [Gordionus sp. m RMFG-2023]|uniref:vacuolar protein sorting-associated protein VTA1 homolog n=1 Tax=Gordionus sp. m RMFG-2023 TaxID=3053472 RepID=UPI0030DE4ACB